MDEIKIISYLLVKYSVLDKIFFARSKRCKISFLREDEGACSLGEETISRIFHKLYGELACLFAHLAREVLLSHIFKYDIALFSTI